MKRSTFPEHTGFLQRIRRQTGKARTSAVSRASAAIALMTALLFSSAANSLFAQESSKGAQASIPPSTTERLVFDLDWKPPWYLFFLPPMNAGEAELSISDEIVYDGRKALKIRFTAHSSGAFASMAGINVDDRFEFLTDPESFCTYRAFKQEREGKRKRDIEVIYKPDSRLLHIRELDLAFVPPKVKRDEDRKDIPQCVQDLFSALYSVRRKEFFPGASYRATIGDNDKVKEVMVRVEKSEEIQTPAGKFNAWKVDTTAIIGGLFKQGGQLKFWLSADAKKIPVQLEVKVNLGTVHGKLKSGQY